MPCSFEIHSNANLLYARMIGKISMDDVRELLASAQKNPGFRPGMLVFNDLSRTSMVDFGFVQMMEISERIRKIQASPNRFGACVFYTPDDLAYGMARMFRALAVPEMEKGIGICRHQDAAFAFLRLDPQDPYLLNTFAA